MLPPEFYHFHEIVFAVWGKIYIKWKGELSLPALPDA